MACPHGYPSPKSCWSCMEDGAVEPAASWVRVGGPFRAQFLGDCANCGGPVAPGDLLQRWDLGDEQTRYSHVGCGSPRD